MSEYHVPVLLSLSIDGLDIQPDGIYVDVTFGGEIAHRLDDKGHLFVFDQDEDAEANLWGAENVTLIISNFRHLTRWMKYYGVSGRVDGILADLGVSSHQFDDPSRGFSYRYDEPLDMRMNQQQARSAADIINQYDAAQLQDVFSKYGEVTNARTLAQHIIKARAGSPITTTGQLADVADQCVKGLKMRYLSQLFQALRIEINDEMGALKELLMSAHEVLRPEGKIAVISYHSLEDRLVKRYFKSGNFEGEPDTDLFGRRKEMWEVITQRPIEPDEEEQRVNPRSRSAKLRIAEKVKSEW